MIGGGGGAVGAVESPKKKLDESSETPINAYGLSQSE
jgi:hypothetical protein